MIEQLRPFHTAPFTSSSSTSYVYISIFDCYKRQNRYYSPVIVIQRFNSSLVAFYRMSKSMWKKIYTQWSYKLILYVNFNYHISNGFRLNSQLTAQLQFQLYKILVELFSNFCVDCKMTLNWSDKILYSQIDRSTMGIMEFRRIFVHSLRWHPS